MRKISFIILLAHITASFNVHAWGSLTHKSIAEIAQGELTPTTENIALRILRSEPLKNPVPTPDDPNPEPARQITRLSQVASWADGARTTPQYKHTSGYHFENINDNSNFLQSLKDETPAERAKGSVVEALLVAEKMLKDDHLSDLEKAPALKFLIHFTGDLHQPLHTGRVDDVGGNAIKVTWFGTKTNLHAVWDTGILYSAHPDILKLDDTHADSPALYAQYLLKTQASHHNEALREKDFEMWVRESLEERPQAYVTDYSSNQKAYLARNTPWQDQRVYVAGIRLGQLLNGVFAHETVNARELLIRKIENIVGSLMKIIDFSPHQQNSGRSSEEFDIDPI